MTVDGWLPDDGRLDELAPRFDHAAVPRVMSVDEALRRSFTISAINYRVRKGRWRRILPRTLLTSDTFTWEDRCAAALTFAGPGALLSGAAGLDDLGLRSVRRPGRLLVLVPPTTRLESVRFVRMRRSFRPMSRDLRPESASAQIARCVADLALEMSWLDDVRALVTEVVRRRLCTAGDIGTELQAGPRNGSAFLRIAVEEALGGAWSAPEAKAARLLRDAGLGGFEQNAIIVLPDGTSLRADFLWRALRAVLEIDSDEHHGLPGDAHDTSERHLRLEAAGYSVVHRTPRFVSTAPEEFVSGVRRWLSGLARVRAS